MTREEAIEAIGNLVDMNIRYHCDPTWVDALKMAIEALSANYTTENPNDIVDSKNDIVAEPTDLISRADAVKAIESRQTEQWIDADVDYNNGLESAIAEIKALPSAETHEIRTETHGVCSDLISRADAIEQIKEWAFGQEFKYTNATEYLLKRIASIPSADRPSGEWIKHNDRSTIIVYYTCSECGEIESGTPPYCRKCGTKMGSDGSYYTNDRQVLEWKPVSEGLPQSVGSYIVTCKDEHGWVYVDYDYWTVVDEFKYNRAKVIAWIPFPKPYCGAKMGSDTR